MNFRDWLGGILGFTTELKEKDSVIAGLNERIVYYQGTVDSLTSTLETTKLEDKVKIAELEKQLLPDPMEVYWDNRYPKINQNYLRYEVGKAYQIDVRNFFDIEDANIPTVQGSSNDDKALAGLIWVIDNITYTPDKIQYGYDEYWAWSFETVVRKKGDCEDGAILLANILIRSGVPYWRVRLNAGSVNGGGHAYVTYCRETDNQFVVLDWCYWASKVPVSQRKLHKDEQNYSDPAHNYGIWFSWNQKYSYGASQTMIDMPKELPVM